MTTDTIHIEHFRPSAARSAGWHIASCNGLRATGASRTEAIAQLLHSLRNEVEVVEIRVEPTRKRGRSGKRVGGGMKYDRLWELTPRERQVAALVSDGLTNPEIARRLGVGEQTVRSHVTAILSKLGVTSRREVRLDGKQAER